jgi:hypothetical protein
MPVSGPFAVTSAPWPGRAAGAPDVVGEPDEELGYSPLLAGGGGTGDLRSWQAASVTTAKAATAASDFSLKLRSVIVISVIGGRLRPVEMVSPYEQPWTRYSDVLPSNCSASASASARVW